MIAAGGWGSERSRAFVALALAATSPLSQRLRAQDLQDDPRVTDAVHLLGRLVDVQQAYERYPGLSIAVVHDEIILCAEGHGHESHGAGP